MNLKVTRTSSGSPFEEAFGFSRALRVDERVLVSGTAPIWPDGSCPDDAGTQATRCFAIAIGALEELGATANDVVRTRMYIVDANDASAIGAVHKTVFDKAKPTATMVVVASLLDPRWKVEIELEAVVTES